MTDAKLNYNLDLCELQQFSDRNYRETIRHNVDQITSDSIPRTNNIIYSRLDDQIQYSTSQNTTPTGWILLLLLEADLGAIVAVD